MNLSFLRSVSFGSFITVIKVSISIINSVIPKIMQNENDCRNKKIKRQFKQILLKI